MLCISFALRNRNFAACTLSNGNLLGKLYRLHSQAASSVVTGLNDALELVTKASTPSNEDHVKRVRLIKDIYDSVQRLDRAENLRIVPFGSFVSSFYDSRSDLDLAVCGALVPQAANKKDGESKEGQKDAAVPLQKLHRRERSRLLRAVAQQLVTDGITTQASMDFLLHARVPLVKFVDRRSGIAVDLCLGTDDVAFKAWSVSQVASIHPAFGKLFRVVKVWAKAHAINDGAAHMFNSWCLTLVVIFFLQRHPQQAPLLPPLHALLHDEAPEVTAPRLMQDGSYMNEQRHKKVMAAVGRRVAAAREQYGGRPAPPLEELFADFVEDGGRLLRALLAAREPFKRGSRLSAFYGDFRDSRSFEKAYYLFVDDPYDSSDNTARTLRKPGRTIDYIISVFERTARRLGRSTSAPAAAAAADSAAATSKASRAEPRSPADTGASPAVSTAGSSSSVGPPPVAAPSVDPSLSSTLSFLFGPELLVRLPELSAQLLGPQLDEWARGAVRAGRPAGEVHEAMLRQLGAAGDFESFDSFKRRLKVRVLNEDKYLSPEDKEEAAALEAERRAAKKAKLAAKKQAEREAEREAQAREAQARKAAREAEQQKESVVESILAAAAEARKQAAKPAKL